MEKKQIKLCLIITLGISIPLMLSVNGWAGLTKESEKCLSCHKDATGFAVKEWQRSKHFKNDVSSELLL